MTETQCALDEREEQLKKDGYVSQKAYYRIGRAIFIVEPTSRESNIKKEALSTPIGTVAQLAGTADKIDDKTAKLLQGLFMPTGYLKILVGGDPDAGLNCGDNTILISGYRFGIDDLLLDGKLLKTTHGPQSEELRTVADTVKFHSWASCDVPDWNTYDGIGYHMILDNEKRAEFEALSKRLLELADWIDHKDEPTEKDKEIIKKNISRNGENK